MNRRIANQLILWRKLADLQTPGLEMLIECLRLILSHNMLPLARLSTSQDTEAETLAIAAAQLGLDRIAAGRMYRDTAQYEAVLLHDSARRGWRIDRVSRLKERRRMSGEGPLGVWRDWPAWLTALYYQFLLTRRPWTYLSLYTARRPQQSWNGELAEIYLGARKKQSSVTRSKDPLHALVADMHDAWAEVQTRVIDTAEAHWLDRLQRELGSDVEPQEPQRYTRLADPILASLHNPKDEEEGGNAYPDLQRARLALRGMTRPSAASAGEFDGTPLLEALDELVPGLDGKAFPVDGALRRWLDGIPARPAGEVEPKFVLQGIAAVKLSETPRPKASATPPQEHSLFDQLMECYEPGSFEQAILIRLSANCDRRCVLTALGPDFPRPDSLDEDAIEAVASRLKTWSDYVEQTSQGRLPPYKDRFLWVEIPPELQNSATLTEARAGLERPLGERWPPAAAAALFAQTLDQLAVLLARLHRKDHGGPGAAL